MSFPTVQPMQVTLEGSGQRGYVGGQQDVWPPIG